MVVAHNRDVVVAEELVVVGMMEEAWLDSLTFRDLSRRHSDVSNELIQTMEAHLDHNFVADCSMEGQMVFFDDQSMREQHLADETKEGKALDSRMVGTYCAHKGMQYSAKRDAAAVVLDPWYLQKI